MDISNLPYELQFKYLLPLPYGDIVQYCRVTPSTLAICGTKAFWEFKAKREFGITGYIETETPDLDFAHLQEAYRDSPSLLLPHLIRTGQIDKAMELLPLTTLGQFIIGVYYGAKITQDRLLLKSYYERYQIDPVTIDLFRALLDTNNLDFIVLFMTHIQALTNHLRAGVPIIKELFKVLIDIVIDRGRYDWLSTIIGQSVVELDIGSSFLRAIKKGDINAVMYFESAYPNTLHKLNKVHMAIESGNPDLIDYYTAKYPEVFTNVSNIDLIVKLSITSELIEDLETILQFIPPETLKSLVPDVDQALGLVEGWLSYVKNHGVSQYKYNSLVSYYNRLLGL